MKVDLNFNKNQLPVDVAQWYNRLWSAIINPDHNLNSTDLANSNDTYNYGRGLNTHITSLLQVFRVTGDKAILDEIDRLAQLMRAQLRDWSILTEGGSTYEEDGYLNWLYMRDNSYQGTDVHKMDEMLAHSSAAAFAYAFYVNRDIDAKYAERATFWTDYLKNHFEAKWRERLNIPTAFPFLEKGLTHAYIQEIRYHYYMYKLTGEQGYLDESERRANIIGEFCFEEEINMANGTAVVWNHGMTYLGGSDLGYQPTNYARYTMQACADLNLEGFSVFSDNVLMSKMANTLAHIVMDSDAPSSFAGNIMATGSSRFILSQFVISPFAQMAAWDSSGRILDISEQAYLQIETGPNDPERIYIPSGVVFALLYRSNYLTSCCGEFY
jgi:hypothetical protein